MIRARGGKYAVNLFLKMTNYLQTKKLEKYSFWLVKKTKLFLKEIDIGDCFSCNILQKLQEGVTW